MIKYIYVKIKFNQLTYLPIFGFFQSALVKLFSLLNTIPEKIFNTRH